MKYGKIISSRQTKFNIADQQHQQPDKITNQTASAIRHHQKVKEKPHKGNDIIISQVPVISGFTNCQFNFHIPAMLFQGVSGWSYYTDDKGWEEGGIEVLEHWS